MGLQVRTGVIFVAEKRLQRLFAELLQPFCCDRLCASPPGAPIAPAVIARSAIEYCLLMPTGDPVRIRNNRPLLCLAFAISQRA